MVLGLKFAENNFMKPHCIIRKKYKSMKPSKWLSYFTMELSAHKVSSDIEALINMKSSNFGRGRVGAQTTYNAYL